MSSIIKVTCPNGHKLAAQPRKAGQTVSCPVCGVKLTIPVPENRKCSDSAVLRILGIDDELRKAAGLPSKSSAALKSAGGESDLLLGNRSHRPPAKEVRNTQICPQCDWEIDAGYKVCPHCHFYLLDKKK